MPKASWNIRQATSDDVATLVEFNCAIARETEDKELDSAVVTRGVARGLQQGDEVVYYLAEDASGPLGSLMLTREWSDWRDGWLIWIQSVYVRADCRGRGVFKSLLEFAIAAARRRPDVVGLRLYVETANQRAQAVYERTGFADPHYKVLERLFD